MRQTHRSAPNAKALTLRVRSSVRAGREEQRTKGEVLDVVIAPGGGGHTSEDMRKDG